MPTPSRTLDREAATRVVRESSFGPVSHGLIGVEVEWFARDAAGRQPNVDTLASGVGPEPLPHGSRVSFEPGGQVELSSLPASSASAAADAVAADLEVVRARLAGFGIELYAAGMEPDRTPRRVTDHPRYAAMEAYFDRRGPDGRRMMSTTAAVQVNVDRGDDEDLAPRFDFLSRLGPVLVAAFANSPIRAGRPTGYRSARMAVWGAIDPTRTTAVPTGGDPVSAWCDYALRAGVMLVSDPHLGYAALPEPMSFGSWIESGHALGHPTEEDLGYHLTTLFPPVRPRGWIELRMIDMLEDPWWRVPLALVEKLLAGGDARARAERAVASCGGLWSTAARWGLEHPVLQSAAAECFAAAVDCEPGAASANTTDGDLLSEYARRYVDRATTPADEALEAWSRRPLKAQTLEAI